MTKLFAVIAHDTPQAPSLRTEHMAAHLGHIVEHLGRLAVAGPLHDAAGQVCGSLLVVKADSEDEARAFMALDPYFAAGVWASIEVRTFSAVAGDWVGGRAW
jgi:uncharacterized protein YciI